ncbi:RluA family pseudouridine synthase [Bacillus xiapuensis]|uniref:RluA family pseudouridine synthase n=1 Tax=Bacillus xiapuensis TaxID=2014075 RepID=UPI000C247009|nr:RluA family pseudouridine synthase [Bacillus xiapuensis]
MYQTVRKGDIFEIKIPEGWRHQTADSLLRTEWKLPKKLIHQWRMNQTVFVNGSPVNWHAPLAEGSVLQLPFFAAAEKGPVPYKRKVNILYEDDHLLVADKPADMKTHPNTENESDTLLNAVAYHLQESGESGFLRHVHRLDVGTSGVILFAKHHAAYAVLSRLLEEREIKRTYIAVVHGLITKNEGTINQPIGKDRHHPSRRRVSPSGQTALTHYKVLKRAVKQQLSLVQCQLDTGRTHQIRVHMASIGHPLAGDCLYGGKPITSHQALHAVSIEIPHPFTGEKLVCKAVPQEQIFRLLDKS